MKLIFNGQFITANSQNFRKKNEVSQLYAY